MIINHIKEIKIKGDSQLATGLGELSLKFKNIFGSDDQFIEVYKHLLDKGVFTILDSLGLTMV